MVDVLILYCFNVTLFLQIYIYIFTLEIWSQMYHQIRKGVRALWGTTSRDELSNKELGGDVQVYCTVHLSTARACVEFFR